MDMNHRQPFKIMQYEVKIGYMGLTTVLEGFEYVLKQKNPYRNKERKTRILIANL